MSSDNLPSLSQLPPHLTKTYTYNPILASSWVTKIETSVLVRRAFIVPGIRLQLMLTWDNVPVEVNTLVGVKIQGLENRVGVMPTKTTELAGLTCDGFLKK